MNFLLAVPALLSFLVLAAHFFRNDGVVFFLVSFGCFLLLLLNRKTLWILRTAQVVLVLGCLEWVVTTNRIAQVRMAEGRDWQRMAIILLSVAAFHLLSAGLLELIVRRKPAQPHGFEVTGSPAPKPQTPA